MPAEYTVTPAEHSFRTGGASCGKPVIHLGPVGIDNTLDINQFAENFEIYGHRMASKAVELFG